MELETLRKYVQGEFHFRIKNIYANIAIAKHALSVLPDNLVVQFVDKEAQVVVEVVLHYLTQEQTLAQYPSDWWQAVKERWFPGWLKTRFPVKFTEVEAIYAYPELAIPVGLLGKTYVKLELLKDDAFAKAQKYEENLI